MMLAYCVLVACPQIATNPPSKTLDSKRDVVVVLLDTLRPDHLGFFGNDQEPAPFLAELADGASVFRRCYSTTSWTAPAVASLFSGLYPTGETGHGILEGFMAFKRREQRGVSVDVLPLNRLPEEVTLMAELFKEAGWSTFGIVTNLNVGPEIGMDRGFDRFQLYRKDDASKVEETVFSWAEEIASSEPAFVYLHFMDPHVPYQKRAPWYAKPDSPLGEPVARYDSEISFLDEHLANIFGHFGWAEDAIVVIVSDHGEEFGDHGGSGHEFQLYSELNRVLMMVRIPGQDTPSFVEANVSLVDVLPTLLALSGVEVPGGLDGMSLLPLLLDRRWAAAAFHSRPVFSHRLKLSPAPQHLWSVIEGNRKLIFGPEGTELYNLDTDWKEQDNRWPEHNAEVEDLVRKLEAFRSRGFRVVEKVRVGGKEISTLLQALGYIEDEEEE